MPAPTPNTAANQSAPRYRRGLHLFTFLVFAATFSLVAVGGHVTSTDSGLAVPDGFTTFGHITLFAPLSEWWHEFGTRWEHSHRLVGNLVGMLTIAMCVWLLITQRGRPWLRWSGVVMLLLVIAQGVMGALRVEELSITLAFVHGIGGQLILCLWVLIAAALSRPWIERLRAIREKQNPAKTPKLEWAVRLLLVAFFIQLTLGAAVRHYKADKAIPDFPLTWSQVIPPTTQDAVDEAYRIYYANEMGITAAAAAKQGLLTNRDARGGIVVTVGQVHLQFAHRLGAYSVFIFGIAVIVAALRRSADRSAVFVPGMTLVMLLGVQVGLGVLTVLTRTDPLAATMHQATGALLIATATWLAIRVHLAGYPAAALTLDTDTADAPESTRPTRTTQPQSSAV